MSDRVIWIYDVVIVGLGESWRDVLHSRGREGWEAWHIDVNGGYRTIYFKRPDDQVATVPSEESAVPSGWLMDPWTDVKILTEDPSSHSLTVEKSPGGWVVACRRCGLRLIRKYQDAEHAGDVLAIASRLQISSLRPACSGRPSAAGLDDAPPDDSVDAEYLSGLEQVYRSKDHGYDCRCDACTAFRVITVQKARWRAAREATGDMTSPKSTCRDPSEDG